MKHLLLLLLALAGQIAAHNGHSHGHGHGGNSHLQPRHAADAQSDSSPTASWSVNRVPPSPSATTSALATAGTIVPTGRFPPLRLCSAGSSLYGVPKGSRELVLSPQAARDVCNDLNADWAPLSAENLREVADVAYECLGFGARSALASWNGDSYVGAGVQIYLAADKQQLPHVGHWPSTGNPAAPMCRRRTPRPPITPPTNPTTLVLPAPDPAKGVTHKQAQALCAANHGILADVSNGDGTWLATLAQMYTKLGAGRSAWARSWDSNTYGDSCLAVTVGTANTSGTVNVPPGQCEAKLQGAVCVVVGSDGRGGRSRVEEEVREAVRQYGVENVVPPEVLRRMEQQKVGYELTSRVGAGQTTGSEL